MIHSLIQEFLSVNQLFLSNSVQLEPYNRTGLAASIVEFSGKERPDGSASVILIRLYAP